jgi:guanine deaminase
MQTEFIPEIGNKDKQFLKIAIDLSREKMRDGCGGPFGAIIVNNDGKIISKGWNKVTSENDPTAHAEMTAIRNACKDIGHFELKDCTIYTSCEPCPMCLGGIYWARLSRVVYANTRYDARDIGFDDGHIYDEIMTPNYERKIKFLHYPLKDATDIFDEWINKKDKIKY